MAKRRDGTHIQTEGRPYPPSWIDHLIAWIDQIGIPTWMFYMFSTLALALGTNALFWIDGSLLFPSLDPLSTGFGIIVFYWLALYHYLTRIGSRSLHSFFPLLNAQDADLPRIDYELSTLPSSLGWLAVPLGVAFAAFAQVTEPSPFGNLVPHTVIPSLGDIVITGFVVASFYCVLIRSVRQLRMVHRLQAQAVNVNLLNLVPAQAFSALTARTGIGFILLLVIGYFVDPESFLTAPSIFESAATMLLAIAIFTVPIMGIRDLLDEEKHRVLGHLNGLLQATSENFHKKVEREEFRDLEGMEKAITALIRERELYERISTWPWDARTIQGFATTLLLPIFLLVMARLLERFF